LQKFINQIADINWEVANHIGAKKKVIFSSNEFESNLTQVAYTQLVKNFEIPLHLHSTMEEVFFVIDGICEFNIQGKLLLAKKESTVLIPANTEHSIKAITNCNLLYFGISI
jgi:mannose-6-phosphate isomerase-like protein (cupin superfamily)